MSYDPIRALIDKLLIEELTSEEHLYLIDKLEEDHKLKAYYKKTLRLKEELQSMSEETPFSHTELVTAREALFHSLNTNSPSYTWLKYVALFLLGVLSPYVFSMLQSEDIPHYIVSMDVQKSNDGSVILKGKHLAEFELQGSINQTDIQQTMIRFIQSNPNIGHKITMLDELSQFNIHQEELIQTYIFLAEEESNLGLRIKAIENLKKYVHHTDVQRSLLKLIRTDNNSAIRSNVFDVLTSLNPSDINQNLKEQIEFLNQLNKNN